MIYSSEIQSKIIKRQKGNQGHGQIGMHTFSTRHNSYESLFKNQKPNLYYIKEEENYWLMDSKEVLNNFRRGAIQTALSTIGIKDLNASRIYYLFYFHYFSLCKRSSNSQRNEIAELGF